MNKHFKKVLKVLKTKAKALGFNYKELKGIAAKIADNLDLEDDASDEDVTSAIDDAVDEAMEYLSVSQSAAQRVIADYKAKHKIQDTDDDDDDPDDGNGDGDDDTPPAPKQGKKGKSRQQRQTKSNEDGDEDVPAWAKSITSTMEVLVQKVSTLEQGNVAKGRRARLADLLKGTEKFGERKLKEFDRIANTFKSEEEFEEYLDEAQEDLDAYNQERSDAGLSKLGAPGAGSPGQKKPKQDGEGDEVEKLTDAQLDELADEFA